MASRFDEFRTKQTNSSVGHESADTDVDINSIHHTLGSRSTQAAPGNHKHDLDYVKVNSRNPSMLCWAAGTMNIAHATWTLVNVWLYQFSHPDIVFSAPGSFIIKKSGIYSLDFTAFFNNGVSSSGVRAVRIIVNGFIVSLHFSPPIAAQGDAVSVSTTTLRALNVNDIVSFEVLHTAGAGNVTIFDSYPTQCSIAWYSGI